MSGDLLWIGFLVVLYAVFKYRPQWVTALVVAVAGKAVGKAALRAQPDTISLEPIEGPPATPEARSAVETLQRRGFTNAGSFAIPEMQMLPVHFLARTEEWAIAVVYEHPQAGVFTDIACRYQDDTRFTITNAKVGGGLETQPGNTTIRAPGLTVAALHLRFSRERPAGALYRFAVTDVPRIFADAYADEMAWRKGQGISKDEVRAVAREMEEPANEPVA